MLKVRTDTQNNGQTYGRTYTVVVFFCCCCKFVSGNAIKEQMLFGRNAKRHSEREIEWDRQQTIVGNHTQIKDKIDRIDFPLTKTKN